MIAAAPPEVLAVLTAKTARTFSYGALGIVLPLHLGALGMDAAGIGLAVTVMLVGSALLTGLVRRPAERFGARATLTALAGLSALAAVLLLAARAPWLVVLAATLGNVAVGTGETGPFLTLEQVVVARAVPAARRTGVLGLYNLVGYAAAAGGAAAAESPSATKAAAPARRRQGAGPGGLPGSRCPHRRQRARPRRSLAPHAGQVIACATQRISRQDRIRMPTCPTPLLKSSGSPNASSVAPAAPAVPK